MLTIHAEKREKRFSLFRPFSPADRSEEDISGEWGINRLTNNKPIRRIKSTSVRHSRQ